MHRPAHDDAGPPARLRNRLAATLVSAALLAAVAAIYAQTLRFDFVYYDDQEYVVKNPDVLQGITPQGVLWAFTSTHACNWHPLTWLSHQLDCELFGLCAGCHHATNLALHAAAAMVLFLTLRAMTGALWTSAFVAAVFAVHPQHVESVAWIAERKDLLSGLFFMLTLAAYCGYVRHPFSPARYGLVVAALALGLMSKPMLVTAPFVLLLLDYWPLGRMTFSPVHGECPHVHGVASDVPVRRRLLFLVLEKLPLLALSAASCVMTALAQSKAIVDFERAPLLKRIGNALISYVAYVGQYFWPVNLSPFYPHRGGRLTLEESVAAAAALAIVTAVVAALWRKRPHLPVGWFWYLGMLVPVIGLIQVGAQAMADRYMYLPQIGLTIALAWEALRWVDARPGRRRVCAVAAAAAILALAFAANRQASHWRDRETLWRHALACDPANAFARHNLGVALFGSGKIHEAIDEYERSLAIRPDCAEARYNLGVALNALGQTDEAAREFQKALELNEQIPQAHFSLAVLLAAREQNDEALRHFLRARELDPGYPNVAFNIGVVLDHQGKTAEALVYWSEALRRAPNDVGAMDQIAWTLATHPDASLRDGARALELAQQANRLAASPDPALKATLAAALAEAGRFAEAVEAAEQALALARERNDREAVKNYRVQLEHYQAGKPYREGAAPPKSSP